MEFTEKEIGSEAARLHSKMGTLGWNLQNCQVIAPLTLEINLLKKEKNAVILAHSYQTPDIIYGVADFTGDSYGLSKQAAQTKADVIVFSGVKFMAETAKLLNPNKKVYAPSMDAGCSLADDITADDVRKLKAKHPGAPVVCYVNTTAEVKAESDVCCTSANAKKIIGGMKEKEIIFVPDEFMAINIARETGKKIIAWRSSCVVHKDFDGRKIDAIRKEFPGVKVLTHSECPPLVAEASDMMGGTTDMEKYVAKSDAPSFMLVTECGLSDRLRSEHPKKEFIGMCSLCPYMKKNSLALILDVLREGKKENEIKIPEGVAVKARKSLEKMFELSS
ncbi:MAG: quinolinate synthase NadA [Candidatus Micrarchaeota archaeon]|nr:quinolinate synthase NadA [Candidatus Micrarchaeota archaeon]